jgi:hypothetical protein
MEHQSGVISTDADPADVSDRAPKCAIVRTDVTELFQAYELSNVMETALAAAQAKRWDVVMHIAEALASANQGMPNTSAKRASTRS